MKVLVTGATGFVGAALRDTLRARSIGLRLATRRPLELGPGEEAVTVGDIDSATDWGAALDTVSVVVHLAARVHVMRETASDAMEAFRRVNVNGTERLARMAVAAGTKRLVYVSSIKVNGEATGERAFTPADRADPQDPYGRSKWEAELALARISSETGLEVVVVRPPLVYGAGVRGNFLRLIKLVALGAPLPFGGAQNLRSLIFVRNLADAIATCAEHPAAAGRTYLVSDGEDLSTADLCARTAKALGRPAKLWRVPPAALGKLAAMTGRSEEFRRLFGSLRIDPSSIRRELDWKPPHTVDEGLAETATWLRTRS